MQRFEKKLWENELKNKDWYILLQNDIKQIVSPNNFDKSITEQIYSLLADLLRKDGVALANDGPGFDKDRQQIDTIVIHHAGRVIEDSLQLSAIGLLRQYAIDYLKGDILGYKLKDMPLWSGHFKDNKQVFFAYHWLVKENGEAEMLLKDDYIGWHAGNWDINKRSIGIVLSGDYENKTPQKRQIKGLISLIKERYGYVASSRIIGHSAVFDTICPGQNFESVWEKQIKNAL